MCALSNLTRMPPLVSQTLKDIFVKADLNKDNKLSFEEIRSVLHELISTPEK